MAIIYDMSTGKVISESRLTDRAGSQHGPGRPETTLQPLHEVNNPQTAAACDAYMVLLQRILKDL
jgi:hypothetical protein